MLPSEGAVHVEAVARPPSVRRLLGKRCCLPGSNWQRYAESSDDEQDPGLRTAMSAATVFRAWELPTGKYKTKYCFAGQMTLSFAKGWESQEDSTGEFSVSAKRNPDSRVVFWEDVYATMPGSLQRVGPPRRTAASLLAWLQSNRNLTVSKPTAGKIGTLRARVVDIGVADDAANDDPTCPAKACANFLGYPQWGEPYGIAGKWISRFYFADVRYGGQRHLFVAVVEVAGAAS